MASFDTIPWDQITSKLPTAKEDVEKRKKLFKGIGININDIFIYIFNMK
jgi:hypothetical protein